MNNAGDGVIGDPAAPPDRRTLRLAIPWLMALLTWLLATSFHLGDLGKWTDDYSISYIDPETGVNHIGSGFPGWNRPLHWFIGDRKATWLWHADRANHWISAITHGLVALAVWRLLLVVVRRRVLAGAGAIVFLVFPLNYEVSLWPAAWSAMASALLALAAAGLVVRAGRRGRALPTAPAVLCLMFFSACWYELPTTSAAALPLLYLACSKYSLGWGKRLTSAAIVGLAACGGAALYLALNFATLPPGARSGAGALVTWEGLPERWAYFRNAFEWCFLGSAAETMVKGSLLTGVRELTNFPGVFWSVAIGAGLIGWLRWCAASPAARDASESPPVAHRPGALAFGTMIFISAWGMILLLKRQSIDFRLMYFPLIGILVVAAVFVDLLLWNRWVHRLAGSPMVRLCGGIVLAAIALVGCVSLVGIQTNLQARYRQDQSEMSQLVRLEPNPPKHTVFLPLQYMSRASNTGYEHFDDFAVGVMGVWWAVDASVRYRYQRGDLASTGCYPGWHPVLTDFTDEGVRSPHRFGVDVGTPDPRGGIWLKWEETLPIIVTRDGRVLRVRRLEVPLADGKRLTVSRFATSSDNLRPEDCVDFSLVGSP